MKLTNNFLLLPSEVIDVEQMLVESGSTPQDARKTIKVTGFSALRRFPSGSLSSFVLAGLNAINEMQPEVMGSVDAIVVVSQSFDYRLPSLSARIQKAFGMKANTYCIDVIDGCSGFIKALSIAEMLESSGFRKILLVAGDINSLMTAESEIGTRVLFGDGVSVSILEVNDFESNVKIFNDGDSKGVLSCSTEDNLMKMNGFEVFRFTRNTIPLMINDYLAENGKKLDDFDLVALHQASKLVVSTMFTSLKFTNTLTSDFSCGNIGNIGAGSIGAWLTSIDNLRDRGNLNLLAVGFGSGLSWGLAHLRVDMNLNEVIYV